MAKVLIEVPDKNYEEIMKMEHPIILANRWIKEGILVPDGSVVVQLDSDCGGAEQ